MQSGFNAGGGGGGGRGAGLPELYAAAQGRFPARSLPGANMNINSNAQQQGIFLDPNSQITQRLSGNLIGKRTLSEYQALQQQQNQQGMNGLFMRSVKQRMMLNNHGLSGNLMMQQQQNQPNSSHFSSLFQERFGYPLLQSLRQQQQQHQQQQIPLKGVPFLNNMTNNINMQQQNHVLSGVEFQACSNSNQDSSDQKMMNQLQEIEKQLLLDDLEDENDDVSVVTNTNSEWSETIQNLISSNDSVSVVPNANGISQSPTSSSSSSSTMASSVASPPPKAALLEAAAAISEGKTESAKEILSKLATTISLLPNSQQRVIESMVTAFNSRCENNNNNKVADLFSQEHFEATQMLYNHSPCFKLGFMAANLAILETAIKEESQNGINKIHVVDFDIGQGNQYVNFIHALSTKQQNGSSHFSVKITSVIGGDSFNGEERMKFVGDSLSQHAQKVGILFSFNLLSQKNELTRESLGCEDDELLAVNFAFKLCKVPDESVSIDNPRDALLRSVKALSPSIVTVVEQEMNTNTAPFMARVNDTFSLYSALFDSIESTVPGQSAERVKVESGLSRRLVNLVACEGVDRVERCEVFGKWRARLSMAGFVLKPLSQSIAESMRGRLASSNRVNPGFTIKEENGGVGFGWMGRTITIASAWC